MKNTGILAAIIAVVTAGASWSDEIGNSENGQNIFKKCQSCHQLGPDAKHKVGPILNGIFGRQAGTAEGFERYSEGLVRAGVDGLKWDLKHLDAYLTNPKSLVSRTNMNFSGLKDAQDRADVIAYLRIFSDNPANIPEAAPTGIPPEVVLAPEILAIVGDAEYGEYLASECLTCHQNDGTDRGIPSITGWPTEDFVIAMHAYKVKVREHPVMQMMAGRLSDEEIAALAVYFKEIK